MIRLEPRLPEGMFSLVVAQIWTALLEVLTRFFTSYQSMSHMGPLNGWWSENTANTLESHNFMRDSFCKS